MRSERVETNLRCNQNCTYCSARRSEDDPRFVALAAVKARIDATHEGELILTGGEPTLRRDLLELVVHARLHHERVTLETNATTIDPARAQALRHAGLDHAVVNLAGTTAALDGVTRDPGGFSRTLSGIDALLGAGVVVTLRAAVVSSTELDLEALPEFVAERFGKRVRALELVVPTHAPERSELLSPSRAAACIARIERRARRVALPLKLAPGSGPPPCVFVELDRVTQLFSLSQGASARSDHRHVESCSACVLSDRCSGLASSTIEHFGIPAMTPITTDRVRRRLAVLSTVEEQVERELVTPSHYRDPVRGDVEEDIIRVVFACNQACRFCFVSTHLPGANDARIEAAIRAAAAADHKVTLSGGEPTLHPRLLDFVRLAKSLSRHPVLLQTNATRMGEREDLARELVEAGVREVFVSLHGATAETSDAVTESPGTFEQTVLGLDACVAAGLDVQINFVICQRNAHELSAWVALLASRWPRAFANVSFVAPSTDVVPRERALVPRYREVLSVLAEAVKLAEARGLTIGGFESMCGVPLCLVPGELDRYFALSTVPPGFDRGEFVKPAPCERCALSTKCWGVRRGYLELYGEDELAPVTR